METIARDSAVPDLHQLLVRVDVKKLRQFAKLTQTIENNRNPVVKIYLLSTSKLYVIMYYLS